MDVTIIIPVYRNSISDIKRCLNSIQNQSFQGSFQVYIIDDGNDISYKKQLMTLTSEYKFLTVFYCPHKGVAAARNYGTIQALSDYVTYVDADDYISPYFLQEGMQALLCTKSDIVYGKVKPVVPNDSVNFKSCSTIKQITLSEKKIIYNYMFDLTERTRTLNLTDSNGGISHGPVAKILRRELSLQCPFPEGFEYGEDIVWNFRILNKTDNIILCPTLWYAYVQNPESATHKFKANQYQQTLLLLNELSNFVNDATSLSHYYGKVFSDLRALIMLFYAHKDNPEKSLFKKMISFNKIIVSIPLINRLNFRTVKALGLKSVLKWLLMKMDVLFWVLYFKAKWRNITMF